MLSQHLEQLDARKQAESAFNLACAEAELGHRDAALLALRGCLAAARQKGTHFPSPRHSISHASGGGSANWRSQWVVAACWVAKGG